MGTSPFHLRIMLGIIRGEILFDKLPWLGGRILISDAEGEFGRRFDLLVSGEIPGRNALDYYSEALRTMMASLKLRAYGEAVMWRLTYVMSCSTEMAANCPMLHTHQK